MAADGDESNVVAVVSVCAGRDILLFTFDRIGMRLGVIDAVVDVAAVTADDFVIVVVAVDVAVFRPLLCAGDGAILLHRKHNEERQLCIIQVAVVVVMTDILCASVYVQQRVGGQVIE